MAIAFMAIIFVSDALDGMISRRFCSPLEQYKFRISDAAIDKVGILAFLRHKEHNHAEVWYFVSGGVGQSLVAGPCSCPLWLRNFQQF